MASSSRLKPNEKGKINVSVDVKDKLGRLSKTVQVYANDPDHSVTTLFLNMRVMDRVHAKKYEAKEIFSPQCRGCHVERGRGKKGFDLFNSDCIVCHTTGKSAKSLEEIRKQPREHIIKALRSGMDKTSMPGWDMRHNGPLRDDEIESLIDIIKKSN